MLVVNCPRCHDPIRLPAGDLPEDAYARCPWCRESFPILDVLKSLPPVLEVISADGQPLTPAGQYAGVAAGSTAGGAQFMTSPGDQGVISDPGDPFEIEEAAVQTMDDDLVGPSAETVADTGSFDFEETVEDGPSEADNQETVPADAWGDEGGMAFEPVEVEDQEQGPSLQESDSASIAPMRVSPSGRRKKKGSGLRMAIQAVLGGLLALPLAGGLLILLGRTPDLGFWPFLGESPASSTRSAAPLPPSTGDSPAIEFGTSLDPPPPGADPSEAALEQIVSQSGEPAMDLPEDATGTTDETIGDDAAIESADTSLSMPPMNDLAMDESADRSAVSESPDPESIAVLDAPATTETIEPMPEPESIPEPDFGSASPLDPREEAPASILPPELNKPSPPPQPSSESAELIAAADGAVEMLDAMASYDGPDGGRKRLLAETYIQIAKACDLATGESNSLRQLAEKLEGSSMLNDIESFVGAQWLRSRRTSDGVALVGSPGSDGQTMTLSSGTVVLLTGGTQLPAAEKILALGKISADGSVQLLLAQPVP